MTKVFVWVGATLLLAGSASATPITVTLTTIPLTVFPAMSAGPFAIAFQLIDGGELGNNTVSLSQFTFSAGGSAASGCPAAVDPCTFGGASGGLGTSVTLTDSSAFNAFIAPLTPGTSLSFVLNLTANLDLGETPDAFAFSILDRDGGSLPTLDPSGADTLLTIFINSANPAILTFGTDASRLTNSGVGVAVSMNAPSIETQATPVPEPATLFLVGCGLAGGMVRRRRLSIP